MPVIVFSLQQHRFRRFRTGGVQQKAHFFQLALLPQAALLGHGQKEPVATLAQAAQYGDPRRVCGLHQDLFPKGRGDDEGRPFLAQGVDDEQHQGVVVVERLRFLSQIP